MTWTSEVVPPRLFGYTFLGNAKKVYLKLQTRLSLYNMNAKKTYIWQLAAFLHAHSMVMSGEELAEHLNRNKFLTSYGTEYEGGRGTYRLITQTWKWLHDELGLPDEAEHVALAFVKPDGGYAYE